ncbi:hypothetical protein AiwAL_18855, partial [Acidiphilium sp. AL]|uniref:hypothetical protein n=1 Tax=Acidiphilium sp. AL TaxID=2871704 RepID=UPI0021CAED91
CFVAIYLAVGAKLIDATVLHPIKPSAAVLTARRPDFRTRLAAPDRAAAHENGNPRPDDPARCPQPARRPDANRSLPKRPCTHRTAIN